MSNEPELSEGESGEWVLYLQQLMRTHLFWNGPEDGTFTPELTDAVRQLQHSAAIDPADGVVRASTWDALHGLSADQGGGWDAGGGDPPVGPATEEGTPNPHAGVGVPSFTYTLPNIPLASVTVPTPNATIHAELFLTGVVQVTFQMSVQGYQLNINDGAWKLSAQQSLAGLQEGIELSGLESGTPSLTSTWGNEFTQYGMQFTPPSTVTFSGQVNVTYEASTQMGPVQVQGQPGYQLVVTVVPNPSAPAPEFEPVDEPSWFSVHATELVAVGTAVLIIGVAIALAPETGGGSLALAAAL